ALVRLHALGDTLIAWLLPMSGSTLSQSYCASERYGAPSVSLPTTSRAHTTSVWRPWAACSLHSEATTDLTVWLVALAPIVCTGEVGQAGPGWLVDLTDSMGEPPPAETVGHSAVTVA